MDHAKACQPLTLFVRLSSNLRTQLTPDIQPKTTAQGPDRAAALVRDRRMSFLARLDVVLMVCIAILAIMTLELQSLGHGSGSEFVVLAAIFVPLFVAVFLVPPPLETLPAGLLPALRQTKPCAMFAGVLLPLPERPPATPYKIF